MAAEARILVVEDEINMARTLAKILSRRGYEVDICSNGREALERLEKSEFDVVITDLNMPVMDGMQLLRQMRERLPPQEPGVRPLISPRTLVLTGHGSTQSAVEAMKLGAAHYIIKPCDPEELLLEVETQLADGPQKDRKIRRLEQENRSLRQQVLREHRYGQIVGETPAMMEIYETILAVSRNKSTVLIQGESGTGKELVARTIHAQSDLADKPFVVFNCGAMSETLLDSQLFGHRKGAFTGAISDHDGVFRAADGGTLFLDEISEIPLSLQTKFLRAIQEKEVVPLGSSQPIRVDVRIITSTNRVLQAEVDAGRFRADLFYRLNVVPILVPPLRERREDIPLLVDHFLAAYSRQYAVAPKRVTEAAMEKLLTYNWPGNVRELQNAIERAFAVSSGGDIDVANLPAAIARQGEVEEKEAEEGDSLPSLEAAERRLIAAALRKSGGNKNQAARILGIDRQRLYRKIEKYNLQ